MELEKRKPEICKEKTGKELDCENCELRLSTELDINDAINAFIGLHNSIKEERFEDHIRYESEERKEKVMLIIGHILFWIEARIDALIDNAYCTYPKERELNKDCYSE